MGSRDMQFTRSTVNCCLMDESRPHVSRETDLHTYWVALTRLAWPPRKEVNYISSRVHKSSFLRELSGMLYISM